jgi:chaperonin GroES
MHVRALNDKVFVRRLSAKEEKVGGIVIPDVAKEKPLQGMVLAAGRGVLDKKGKLVPLAVAEGDRVVFGKFTGETMTLDGEEIMVMRDDEILGVVEG